MRLDTMGTEAITEHMRAAHRCAMRARSGNVADYFASIAADCLAILQERESVRATVASMFAPFTDSGAADTIAACARAFLSGPSYGATKQCGNGSGGSRVRRVPRKPRPGAPQLATVL